MIAWEIQFVAHRACGDLTAFYDAVEDGTKGTVEEQQGSRKGILRDHQRSALGLKPPLDENSPASARPELRRRPAATSANRA
jgi:hypothetical protein